MHIPDGFLAPEIWAPLVGVSAVGVIAAERMTRWAEEDPKVPLMGVLGAFIFAAQMINFPVPGGTSGHLIGGALLAMLVGPCAAILVMTCILIVQCFLLQDGGMTALGANVFNLGIVAPLVGYGVIRVLGRGMPAVFIAGWLSVLVPAALAGVQIGLSGNIEIGKGVLLLSFWHAIIGVPEGVITVLILKSLMATRPDVVPATEGRS
jgi:cobalt/nickel transport system permease protein